MTYEAERDQSNALGIPPVITRPAPMPGPPAALADRFVARLIDAGVVVGLLFVLALVGAPLAGHGGLATLLSMLMGLGMLGVYFGYEFFMIGRYGQTVGKRVMRIRVVQVDGASPSWQGAAARTYVPMIASLLTCGLGGFLFYLSPLFDSTAWNRGWYDKVASTVVIRSRQ